MHLEQGLHFKYLPPSLHDAYPFQYCHLLHHCSDRIMVVCGPLPRSRALSANLLIHISLAEIATIILCTCFPRIPRVLKLVSDDSPSLNLFSTSSSSYFSRREPRIGNNDGGSRSGRAIGAQDEEMARLQDPYERMGDEICQPIAVLIEPGRIRKTVDIELSTWDPTLVQCERASMV